MITQNERGEDNLNITKLVGVRAVLNNGRICKFWLLGTDIFFSSSLGRLTQDTDYNVKFAVCLHDLL